MILVKMSANRKYRGNCSQALIHSSYIVDISLMPTFEYIDKSIYLLYTNTLILLLGVLFLTAVEFYNEAGN